MISHPATVLAVNHPRRRFALAAVCCLMLCPAPARADVVLDWNVIAVNTAIQAGQSPFAQARYAAIVQLAVFTAVNSITGEYERYVTIESPAPGASAEAAAATAAYRVLSTYFGANPTIQTALNTALAASLAAIADTGEAEGVATGEAAAAAMLALRANDGSSPATFYTVPPGSAGDWEATPSCPVVGGVQVGAFFHWRNVTPFGVESVSTFLPKPPPSLTSNAYAKAFEEVMRVGRFDSPDSERPRDRQDVVNFYAVSSPTYIVNMIARQLAEAEGRSMSDNARSLALVNMATSDALVASFHAKYEYNFWRPETAIRAGETDGNDKTVGDPGFRPYITTPCFPSYPSNHASGSSAGLEMLRRLYGAAGFSIELTSPNPLLAGITLQYSQLGKVLDDVSDARVYGGIHFRFDQDAGDRLGREIATAVYKDNLRSVHPVR